MGTNINREIDLLPEHMEFAIFSNEEIKKLSVVKIITGLTFDPLGHPLPGGLYDNVMGPYGRTKVHCLTCLNIAACPGHMGHIELNGRVYNPFFIKVVQKILNLSCLHCFSLQIKSHVVEILVLQLRLIDAGYIVEAKELEIYRSEIVCANVEPNEVKLEAGMLHPRIVYMHKLLESGSKEIDNNKSVCAVRSAIVNAALERPTSKKCIHCSGSLKAIRYLHKKLVYFISKAELKTSHPEFDQTTGKNKDILADECNKYLRDIYGKHKSLLDLLFPVLSIKPTITSEDFSPVDLFFMDVVPVTPPTARPSNTLRDQIIEHPQTSMYRNIIENNNLLRVIIKFLKGKTDDMTEEAQTAYNAANGKNPHEKFYNAWHDLQESVNVLLDAAMNRDPTITQGLKQILEKKEGLIRKHMMGKRVNFAARTVITPDPNINVEEVGIPVIFAKKLSYPVPVTAHNVTELRKMVINGPDNHPGANYIQDEKGYTTFIPHDDEAKRESMAKLLLSNPENGMKIVHRHVLNGDILLLNRQPSLHKPSIMAHKARILSGEKTFRMHYSNCKAYNADFDGDEMNAHLPQSEVARAEAYNLVNVANNYLVPKDGTPLGGLIQDHVISGVKLSMRGRFFNREDYQQLVYQGLASLRGKIELLPPTIIKPIKLWSGKQILSTIIINLTPKNMENINLNSKAKMNSKVWQRERNILGETLDDLSESQVIIRNGELLVGVLDKQQYGATTYGLVHCMYELYGGDISTGLLTALTKVFTFFLQREGFTLGVKDILVSAEGDKKRQKIIKECRQIGEEVVTEALGLPERESIDVLAEKMEEAYVKDPNFRLHLDRTYKSYLDNFTNDINKQCIPFGLIEKFPYNNLQLMVQSGAKGSLVNTMQISSLLGQIELEGKRPPLMISGKSLPSFTSFETSPKSGGFIDGRFMTGIQPQDFFFHCMAGREGLIDTAVKTSRSGYLQRCLIKHLEGLTVAYDLTVRDSDNSVVQYLYGEDGLDILKSKFFDKQDAYEFLFNNIKAIVRPHELALVKDEAQLHKIMKHSKAIKSWIKKNKALKEANNKRLPSPFVKFCFENVQEVDIKNPNKISKKTGRTRLADELMRQWYEQKYNEVAKLPRCPDPVISKFKQDNIYGSVSERLAGLINKSLDEKTKKNVADVLYLKNLKAVASPGEPVGLIAAQSIGEPSTQMTLNTFHFAGRGEMNVTLGIPRLREILMLASSNIKTPAMEIPIKEGQLKNAQKLRISLNRVTLADILQYVKVKVKTLIEPERVHQYKLHFEFLPRAAYKNDFCVKPKFVIKYMTNTFMKQLFRSILKSSQKKGSIVDVNEKKKTHSKDKEADEGYEEDDEAEALNQTTPEDLNDKQSDDDGNSSEEDEEAAAKVRNTDYDEPEEVEEIEDVEGKEDKEDEEEEDSNQINVSAEPNDPIEDEDNEKEKEQEEDKEDKILSSALSNNLVTEFVYDKKDYLWCKWAFNLQMRYEKPNISSLIRELAQKSVIHQVPNIKRSIISNPENGKSTIKTEGINIIKMFLYDKILDVNALYSNDIHAIAKTYGIEAAQRVIIKEVSNVFKVYGITVDYRHLSLIADYMTFDGTFQPLSRKGMEHSSSPLQQMSFESSLQFLKNATSAGKKDAFQSPSSRLMVGLPVKNGTGCFELLAAMTENE